MREYASSTFARVCMLEIANSAKWGPDSIIKFSEEILKIHPQSRRALVLASDAYQAKGMEEKYLSTLTTLLAADPTNTNLQAVVVDALGAAGKPEVAKPIIDEAVKQNPGDPSLIRLQWKIYGALKDWKGVIAVGEEMIKTDTAAADTVFWQRLVGAYVADSQHQKATEAAARGAQKFPNNPTLWISYAQLARQTGQLPQALEAINKVLAIDPKYPGAHFQKARIFFEQDNLDSLSASLRAAVAAGEDKATAAGMMLPKANQMFQAYQKDSVKTIEQGERVLAVLAFADSLNSSETTGFLMGASQLLLAQALLTEAGKTKNCDQAKRAGDLLINAQGLIGKNGRPFGQAAGQAMQAAMQLTDYANRTLAAFKCK
jgi:Flp pilus assembly protein TadD